MERDTKPDTDIMRLLRENGGEIYLPKLSDDWQPWPEDRPTSLLHDIAVDAAKFIGVVVFVIVPAWFLFIG